MQKFEMYIKLEIIFDVAISFINNLSKLKLSHSMSLTLRVQTILNFRLYYLLQNFPTNSFIINDQNWAKVPFVN